MGQRYWVIGGEYRDCQFDEVVPGTEEISRPVRRRAPGAHRMAAADFPRPLRGDDALFDHAWSRSRVSTVIDRPRIVAAPVERAGRGRQS